jgi:1-piperideine-2-carboxylate/1-pyrroline-2-carboxylate reductase [NAD(P)H]
MKTLDAQSTSALTPYSSLVDALRRAAMDLARQDIKCPHRQVLPINAGGVLLSMVAVAADLAVHKLVTFVPGNVGRALPAIQGQVSVWDASTGSHVLTLDGATVTGRRTAALSMLGVLTLQARRPARVHIIGTGTQARHHVEAIADLFPEARITVAGRSAAAAENFCAAHAKISASLSPAPSSGVDSAVDLVIACTTSSEPVYAEAARSDRMVIAVGAFTPAAAEIGAATVRASRVYVDDVDSARHEAGDLIRAGVDWAEVQPLSHALRGGNAPDGAVLFKTVGHAAWDLAAARVAVATVGA